MPIIIDGYNLLNAAPVPRPDAGASAAQPGTLEAARDDLLVFLAEHLLQRERHRTTVVFDASQAPPGLARREQWCEIEICYASDFRDADAMIEHLVRQHSAPRTVTVVSSDHRVQRAARRRRAEAVDSDQWCRRLRQRRRAMVEAADSRMRGSQTLRAKAPLSSAEVEAWLSYFGFSDSAAEDRLPPHDAVEPVSEPDRPSRRRKRTPSKARVRKSPEETPPEGANRQTQAPRAVPKDRRPPKTTAPPEVFTPRMAVKPRTLEDAFSPEYLAEVQRLLAQMQPPVDAPPDS